MMASDGNLDAKFHDMLILCDVGDHANFIYFNINRMSKHKYRIGEKQEM